MTLAPFLQATRACALAYGSVDANAWRARGWDVDPRRWGSTEAVILERGDRLLIAYAGSNEEADWSDNYRIWPRRWRNIEGRVHRGFARHYDRSATVVLDRIDAAITRVRRSS